MNKVEIQEPLLIIHFNYNPTILRKVKTLKNRSYNWQDKTWSCPNTKENRRLLITFGFEIPETFLATEIISNLPDSNIKITLKRNILIQNAPENLLKLLKEKLTMVNPKWIENNRMGRYNRDTEQILKFYREYLKSNCFVIPRGLFHSIYQPKKGIILNDEREDGLIHDYPHKFKGVLKPFQNKAEKKVLEKDFGVLAAPTGSGKTVMALSIIAKRYCKTMIIVHTKPLLKQWMEKIETFLGISQENIGVIGDGEFKIGNEITVAMVQSLYNKARELSNIFGFLVVDEFHRTPSRTFTKALAHFNARYVLGLSATVYRRDKLSKLIFWYLGELVHEIKSKDLIESGDILPLEVKWRETDFNTTLDPVEEYSKVLSELTQDIARNTLICDNIAEEYLNTEGIILVLTDRKNHCNLLMEILLRYYNIQSWILTGDTPEAQRDSIKNSLEKGKIKVLIATGQLIGEGYDLPALSSLFLATPLKYKGRLIQYVGRVRRPSPGKTVAKIFDYIDSKIPVFKRTANSRKNIYKKA